MKIIKIYGFPEKQKSSGNKAFDLNPLLPEPVDFQGFFNREKIKVRNRLYQRLRTFVVGVAGFEPAASWTRTKRDTKLRHTPIAKTL